MNKLLNRTVLTVVSCVMTYLAISLLGYHDEAGHVDHAWVNSFHPLIALFVGCGGIGAWMLCELE